MILLAGAIVMPLTGKSTLSHAQGTVTITEFPLPTSGSRPAGITAGPDGNLWFTEVAGNKIGRITPSGTITEFPIPTARSIPEGITLGPDGNLWFAEGSAYQIDNIGRITPSGTITEFPLPTSGSGSYGITAGPDGNLWFAEEYVGKIGRVTPSGTITEFPLPTGSSGPEGITAGPDGNLWFTENPGTVTGSKIGRITPSGTITEFPTPDGRGPVQITAGPDGNLWFTENLGSATGSKIGRITPSGTITAFPLPTGSGGPEGITAGPDGNLWFTESGGNLIGQITPSGTITEFQIPTLSTVPEWITAGPDGNLWFTESDGNNIGRVNLSKTTLWGVDSFNPITTKFYKQIVATFGQPDFFGKKIGDANTAFGTDTKTGNPCAPKPKKKYTTMTPSEVTTAHSLGLAILPFFFSFPTLSAYDDVNGIETWHCGEQYAKAIIEFAQSAPGFAISQGTAIFVDIENTDKFGTPVSTDADFIQGWFDTFNTTWTYTSPYSGLPQTYQAGYYKAGYYANTIPTSSNFDTQFCTAVSREAAIGTNSFIWTTQPNKATLSSTSLLPIITQKANAPSYNPRTVSCPPLAVQIPSPAAWQYAINSQTHPYKINVDIDEALSGLPLWKP